MAERVSDDELRRQAKIVHRETRRQESLRTLKLLGVCVIGAAVGLAALALIAQVAG